MDNYVTFRKASNRCGDFALPSAYQSFFADGLNMLNKILPANAPYNVLYKGLEVMAQLPLAHPSKE